MHFDILTIFPEFFKSCFDVSLLGKALKENKFTLTIHNIRDYCTDKHKSVDDLPYGGGAGMVFRPEPVVKAFEALALKSNSRKISLSPRGSLFHQKKAFALTSYDQLILLCGRYEGIDERIQELVIDEEISIGDYILNGGEAAALVILDTIVRLIPGVLGNERSLEEESFSDNLLEYPQYTRPPKFRGLKVPQVLLSGNHKEIEKWRQKEALSLTASRRPDLLGKPMSDEKKLRLQYEKKEDRG